MTMRDPMDEKFKAYLAGRDAARLAEMEELFSKLSDRERLLVKEAAVMGFVQGTMEHGGRVTLPDQTILLRTLGGFLTHPDLYPTVTGYEAEEEDDEAAEE